MLPLNSVPAGEPIESAESVNAQAEFSWRTRVKRSFKTWVVSGKRANSPQVPFGAWWEMEGMVWRVAWIEKTGELYATELSTERFIILGRFRTKREVTHKMRDWFGGDNLDGLIHQLMQSEFKKKSK